MKLYEYITYFHCGACYFATIGTVVMVRYDPNVLERVDSVRAPAKEVPSENETAHFFTFRLPAEHQVSVMRLSARHRRW
jgi:hypothetical protein